MLHIKELYSKDNDIIRFVYSIYEDRFGSSFSEETTNVSYWNNNYAITMPKRYNPEIQVDNNVFITAEPLMWCQIIYQLGHEFSHIAMGCYPDNNNLKWISECLCGAASIYALKKSIDFFKKKYPSYVKSVEKYIDDILIKSPMLTQAEIKKYISDNMVDLKADPTESATEDRPRNEVIRKHWAEIIEKNEEGWSAIALFSEIEDESMDEEAFLKEWYQKCRNENEWNFVRSITKTII